MIYLFSTPLCYKGFLGYRSRISAYTINTKCYLCFVGECCNLLLYFGLWAYLKVLYNPENNAPEKRKSANKSNCTVLY